MGAARALKTGNCAMGVARARRDQKGLESRERKLNTGGLTFYFPSLPTGGHAEGNE